MLKNLPADYVTSQSLDPHLRKQGGFESTAIETQIGNAQIIEVPLCYLATTANITLSGLQTIDTVTTPEGFFVLVKDQTDAKENDIYIAQTGAWLRWGGLRAGMIISVRHGSVNNDTIWMNTNESIEVGVTDITFSEAGGSDDIYVKARSTDTTAGYLNDKVSVLRGLVKSILNSGGNEQVQIAMPGGTNHNIMRFDGTNWVKTELIKISANTLTADMYPITTDGNYVEIGRNSGTSSTRYMFQLYNSGIFLNAGGTVVFSVERVSGNAVAKINGYNFKVSGAGVITAPLTLNGTGNRPVYSDSSGNLINYVNNLVIKQNADITDTTAAYKSSDFVFTADAGRQHTVKYCIEFHSAANQDIRLQLNTADTGMTASGTVKVRRPGEYMRVLDNGTSFFFNADFGNSIDIALYSGGINYVEIELYVLPTSNAVIQLQFKQVIPDAINPLTLKANSRMIMKR